MADLSAVEKQKYKIFKNQVDLDKPYKDQNILLKGNTSEEQFNKFKGLMESEKGFIGNILDAINPFASAEASDLGAIQDAGLKELFESQITGTQTDPTDLFPQLQIQDLVDPSVNIDEFGVGSLDALQRLIDAKAAEQAPVAMRPVDPLSSLIPQVSGFVGPQFRGVGSLGRDDKDVEQVSSLTEPTGIRKLLQFLPFGDKSLLRKGLSAVADQFKSDPRAISMRNFYGNRFGLTGIGQVASGPMRGYNPVSGGLFGREKTFGLDKSIADRIRTRSTIGQARINERFGKDSKRALDFAAKTKELQNLGKDERGNKSLDKAFDRDRTRAKDLDRMRGGVGR